MPGRRFNYVFKSTEFTGEEVRLLDTLAHRICSYESLLTTSSKKPSLQIVYTNLAELPLMSVDNSEIQQATTSASEFFYMFRQKYFAATGECIHFSSSENSGNENGIAVQQSNASVAMVDGSAESTETEAAASRASCRTETCTEPEDCLLQTVGSPLKNFQVPDVPLLNERLDQLWRKHVTRKSTLPPARLTAAAAAPILFVEEYKRVTQLEKAGNSNEEADARNGEHGNIRPSAAATSIALESSDVIKLREALTFAATCALLRRLDLFVPFEGEFLLRTPNEVLPFILLWLRLKVRRYTTFSCNSNRVH